MYVKTIPTDTCVYFEIGPARSAIIKGYPEVSDPFTSHAEDGSHRRSYLPPSRVSPFPLASPFISAALPPLARPSFLFGSSRFPACLSATRYFILRIHLVPASPTGHAGDRVHLVGSSSPINARIGGARKFVLTRGESK